MASTVDGQHSRNASEVTLDEDKAPTGTSAQVEDTESADPTPQTQMRPHNETQDDSDQSSKIDSAVNAYSTEGVKVESADDHPSQREQPIDETIKPSQSRRTRKPERQASDETSHGAGHKLHRFSLYETNARYFITGADITDNHFKVLKVDRTSPPGHLSIFEDDIVYSKQEVTQLLTAIDDGNKATGGLRLKLSFWGLLGFIRFTEAYYMLLVTKRQQVAMLGGHYVYQIENTELVPLNNAPGTRFAQTRNPEEARFLGILNNLDLSKSFYFSYSYDITRTLQHNIIRERNAMHQGSQRPGPDYNDMFVWNHHLLKPAAAALENLHDWCLPIIHGFIDQASIDVFGRMIYITIIGRRSRFFAGARFLKRGANDEGYVANDVETEQIVSELQTTSFHAPGPRFFSNPTYTSYVHHRGSIPLYWTQDNSGVTPKPDIDLNLNDPFYQPAALHFDDLFQRYGSPVYVLNLIKARERTPRESKLLNEFKNCIDYLDQFLPDADKIIYKAFDMSRASKTRGGDVIGTLENIAEEIMTKTGFFHNGDTVDDAPNVQNGIARTNCIDCLDRTNAAQFVIGKRAFGHQLKALGVVPTTELEYDSDAINIFTHMFHDHGDTIAVQYGGSHLVNTMATYRKINHWQSSSRDMVESFKRYYHNSFLDSQRQEAYNLFLGYYIWVQGQPMLWELATDYYLHHTDPRAWLDRSKLRRSYIDWYKPAHLEKRILPPPPDQTNTYPCKYGVTDFDDYWLEYYRPLVISSFLKIYSYKINSTNRYLPDRPTKEGAKFDFSPFIPRLDPTRPLPDSPEKKPARKGVTIADPQTSSTLPSALHNPSKPAAYASSILRDPSTKSPKSPHKTPEAPDAFDKTQMHQWTLNKILESSLNPSVSESETAEYDRYISHPSNIPLVVSSDSPDSDIRLDFKEYILSGLPAADGYGGYGDESYREETPNAPWDPTPADLSDFQDFVRVAGREDALTVTEDDGDKRRYKAYRQWLVKGKSLFKQSKVDPEYLDSGTGYS